MSANNCRFLLPHELTGMGECCGLFKGQLGCNGYGKRCVAYVPHTAESRKALAEAIAERRKQTEEAVAMPPDKSEISRAHRAGEHNNNNKPNNKGSNQ